MNILVTGGAGYIGSHMVRVLLDAGHAVTVLDDLSTGHADAVPAGLLVVGSTVDAPLLDRLLPERGIEAVIHFAACSQVGESVREPLRYYANNVGGSLGLVQALVRHGIDQLVFSSTAAVYGEPETALIDETHPTRPINPYGHSKRMVEQILADAEAAHGLRAVCLRYFNAAGAHPDGSLRERHDPETHLIPLALDAAAGRRAALSVFGSNYPTRDGTALRDYIHVMDLCEAHLRALQYLMAGGAGTRLNLGIGRGYTVREVIAAVARVSGRAVPAADAPRRAGDPVALVANPARAMALLGWQPRFPDIDEIVGHAWRALPAT